MNGSVPAGGPASLHGFLYQLLSNLSHVAKARITGECDGDPHSLLVTLEPGAGDARMARGGRVIVEQYKTRSGNRTWNATEVVDEVLPDLFGAVPAGADGPCTYRFVTDGRAGRWKALRGVCGNLAREPEAEPPGSTLDDATPRSFANERTGEQASTSSPAPRTDRAFFRHVADRLPNATLTDPVRHLRRVRHLLANLELIDGVTMESLDEAVDALLRLVVEYREDVPIKRAALVGLLLDKSTCGSFEVTPEGLLIEAGISAKPLIDRQRLASDLLEPVAGIARSLGYDPTGDRLEPLPIPGSVVVAIVAESGSGKTWRMCSAVLDGLRHGAPGVLVRSRGSFERTLQGASDAVWVDAQNGDRPLAFRAMVNKLRGTHGFAAEGATPLLTVFVDDVQTASEARDLAREVVACPGVTLVISAPTQVGRALLSSMGRAVAALVEVPPFSPGDLRAFLSARGRSYAHLPEDLRELLRRPVLADAYCRVERGPVFAPRSEYELFEAYFDEVWSSRELPEHPGDRERLVALAARTLEGTACYPWTLTARDGIGFDDALLRRLESVGIVRRTPDQAVEVVHDRLLNWLAAEGLAQALCRHELSTAVAADRIASVYGHATGPAGRRLDYVAMDALWMLARAGFDPVGIVEVLRRLEGHPIERGGPHILYGQLVPTLGGVIVPGLVERLRAEAASPKIGAIGSDLMLRALAAVARSDPGAAGPFAGPLLRSKSELLVEAALAIAAEAPDPSLLDELWEVHVGFVARSEEPRAQATAGFVRLMTRRRASTVALRKASRERPGWLDAKIVSSCVTPGHLDQVVYLLLGLEREAGLDLWRRHRAELVRCVPADRRRCLIAAIRHFRDDELYGTLAAWLDVEGGYVSDAAFAVLAEVEPDVALGRLDHVLRRNRFTTSWWCHRLMLSRPVELRRRLAAFEVRGPDKARVAHHIYKDLEAALDEETWSRLLDELGQRLEDFVLQGRVGTHPSGPHPMNLVADVTHPDHLKTLRARRTDGPEGLDGRLLGYAVHLLSTFGDADNPHDGGFRQAVILLERMGSALLDDLVAHAMRHGSPAIRSHALYDLLQFDGPQVRAALVQMAGPNTRGTPLDPRERRAAALRTAARGADNDPSVADAAVSLSPARSKDSETAPAPCGVPGVGAEASDADSGGILTHAASEEVGATVRPLTLVAGLDPAGAEAVSAATALFDAGREDAALVNLLRRMSQSRPNRELALGLLGRMDDPDARGALLETLLTGDRVTTNSDVAWTAALPMLDGERRVEASNLLRAWHAAGYLPIGPDYLRRLPEILGDDAHDTLLELASSGGGGRPEVWVSALDGLGRLDPEAAFAAAAARLGRASPSSAYAVGRLIAVWNPSDAMSGLCEGMVAARAGARGANDPMEAQVRAALCRAGRVLPTGLMERQFARIVGSGEPPIREAACDLVGWQDSPFGEKVLDDPLDDPDEKVRGAAVRAIWRRRSHGLTLDLIAEARSADATTRSAILAALAWRVDPTLGDTDGDSSFVMDLPRTEGERDRCLAVMEWRGGRPPK